jgi:uncharacterized protein YicC (UPF0701 family)
MPSTTAMKAAPSPLAMATRSWFSSRFPSRLRSACSRYKAGSGTRATQVNSLAPYSTPRCAGLSGVAALQNIQQSRDGVSLDPQHDRFRTAGTAGPWGTLACELRSVNHRYLELSLRLPDDLRSLEGDARQLLGATLKRGKVEAGIYLRGTTAASTTVEINRPLIEQLLRRAAEVSALAGAASAPMSPLDILRWPGAIRDADRDPSPVLAETISLLRETIGDLNDARAREGGRLREAAATTLRALAQQVATVRTRLPEVSARLRAKVAERVAQLGVQVDPSGSSRSWC